MTTTRELLAEFTRLVNLYGADSAPAKRFIDEHVGNSEFVELANLTRKLKKALTNTSPWTPADNGA